MGACVPVCVVRESLDGDMNECDIFVCSMHFVVIIGV